MALVHIGLGLALAFGSPCLVTLALKGTYLAYGGRLTNDNVLLAGPVSLPELIRF